MLLSEAIRLGAMLKPQSFYPNLEDGSCALMAAGDAVGIRTIWHAEDFWPWLKRSCQCPACIADFCHVTNLVTHLNDEHRWSREAIAHYISTMEPATIEPAAQPQPGEAEVLACR